MQQEQKYYRFSLLTLTILFLIMTFFFLRLSNVISENELVSIDIVWTKIIQEQISEQITPIMNIVTFFGSTLWFAITTIAIFLVFFFIKKRKQEAILFVSTMAFSGAFNQLLKWIFQRPRPTSLSLIEASGHSFPSGHSMASFTFYGLITFLIIFKVNHLAKKVIVVLLAAFIILMIGISRIYLGVHYPTDVLAGFIAGAATLILFLIAYRLTIKKPRHS